MRSRRRSIVLALLLSGVAVVVPIVVPTVPARAATDPTVAGLNWLERELAANGHRVPSEFGDEFTDWGLTIDFIFALAGGRRGNSAETSATTSNVMANAASYVTGVDFGSPDERYAGPLGKLLLVAQVQGVDTTNLGGLDIEVELRARMQTSGPQLGRFSDVSAFGDFSNGFGQAFAVLALDRTSGGVPAAAVSFLIAQQCPGGGFRLFYDSGDTCTSDGEADTDGTAMAIEALLVQTEASGAPSSLNRAVSWLASRQNASGAFVGTGPTATPNANTTGLAARAMLAAGQASIANKAGAWIQTLQLTEDNVAAGPAAADVGAIAYDPASRDAAIDDGISPQSRDRVRRATAQGVLALPAPPAPADGAAPSSSSGTATTSVSVAQPGQEVVVFASGFVPSETVDLTLFSDPVPLGSTVADSLGRATFAFNVPADTTPGVHRIELVGRQSQKSLSVSLQVTPSSTTTTTTVPGPTASTSPAPSPTTAPAGGTASEGDVLPTTGADSHHHAGIAIALIALGTVLVALGRRHARSAS